MSSVTFWLSFWVQFVLLGIGKLTDYPSETSTVNGSWVRVGTCDSFRSCVQILTDVIFYGSSVNNPSCWAHECRAPLRSRRPYQPLPLTISLTLFFMMIPEPTGKVENGIDAHLWLSTLWTLTSWKFLLNHHPLYTDTSLMYFKSHSSHWVERWELRGQFVAMSIEKNESIKFSSWICELSSHGHLASFSEPCLCLLL